MSEIKNGDIVRLTIEGPWTGFGDRRDGDVVIASVDGQFGAARGDKVTIELIEPAVKPIGPGDFIKDVADKGGDPDVYLVLDDGSHVLVKSGVRCCETTNFQWFERVEVTL